VRARVRVKTIDKVRAKYSVKTKQDMRKNQKRRE